MDFSGIGNLKFFGAASSGATPMRPTRVPGMANLSTEIHFPIKNILSKLC